MSEATGEATTPEEARRQARARGLLPYGDFEPATGLHRGYEPFTLGALIGENVKRIREARGLTQHELVQQWRKLGMNWARSKLSALESGDRTQVSASDLLLIATSLDVSLDRLAEGDGQVWLTPNEAQVSTEWLREALSGMAPDSYHVVVGAEGMQARDDDQGTVRLPQQPDLDLAQRLGVDVREVMLAAQQYWNGLTLTAERDRRVAAMGEMGNAERAAHRGHVTRELAVALEQFMRDTSWIS